MSSARRPEHIAPPELYYNETEAGKYTQNTRNMEVQRRCTERALELLALPEDEICHILDLGCGSGMSSEVAAENGHIVLGFDISDAMLDIASDSDFDGDLVRCDIGHGLPVRYGSCDGAIGISSIQWLCYSFAKTQDPKKRLYKCFVTLFACLRRGSRAAFQFYPENAKQIELIETQALRAGFSGGVVVDYPNSTKAKKYYLVLMTGGPCPLPKGLTGEEDRHQSQALYERRDRTRGFNNVNMKKEWIKRKKERRQRQGKEVRPDSKFTGRKRSGKF